MRRARGACLVVMVALLPGYGCATYSAQAAMGVDPHPPGEAARRPPVTRQGMRNELIASHGQLRPLETLHGKASYYHDSLSGNLTANGEIYRKGTISAAHLTLPFCTVVRVIRKDTGHTVIVRINDRGPYGNRGRILDLSKAAAKAIDMVQIGVAPIRAEILEMGDGCTFHHRHY